MARDTDLGLGRRTEMHFAGSNTPLLTKALRGESILVSYADIRSRRDWWENTLRPMLESRRVFRRVILDSGAFTVISAGITIGIEEYVAFCREHGHLFDTIINLDDIAGDVAVSEANLAELKAAGIDAMPVFHQDEPFEVLERMVAEHGYVGIGFARHACTCGGCPKEKRKGCLGGRMKYGRKANRAWLAEVFARTGDTKVHGLAMTSWCDEYPFESVDSTTWIAEYRAVRKPETGHYDKPRGTHGVSGELADLIDWYGDAEYLDLVVGSYRALREGGAFAIEAGHEAELRDWIETRSRGQARTVFRRYGSAARVSCMLTELDLEVEARECRPAYVARYPGDPRVAARVSA